MHIHEKTCSPDSEMALADIVTDARRKGLDGICITDHDSMGLRAFAENYSKEISFPIFVGVEYYSLWGDITAWGIDSFPDRRVSAQDFINSVEAAGGFCVACHPFRNNNRGLEEHLREVRHLGGIEVLNGSTDLEANRLALAYCEELGCVPIGASDAHWISQVGKFATWFPELVYNLSGFIRVLRAGGCKPAILEPDGYRVVDRF